MIKIVVDSSSDYSLEEIKQNNLELVPLYVTFGDTTYADKLTLTQDDFYQMLLSSAEFPKTSQPSPEDFLNLFEKAKEDGDELICILLSSGLSGTYQNANLAKNLVGYEKIHIIDSRCATAGVRILADHGQKLIREGLPAKEITAQLEQLKLRIKIAAGLDTLEYLRRGGRIGRAAAFVGELARLKPLLMLGSDGAIDTIGKCLGKNKAISQLLRFLETNKPDPAYPLYTIYTCGTENVEKLEQKLGDTGYAVQSRQQLGSALGAHLGPNVFGLVYITAE